MSDEHLTLACPAMPRAHSSMSLTEVAASAAARAFFYPSVLWNIARNRLQNDWAWWSQITEVRHPGLLQWPGPSMYTQTGHARQAV